MNLLEAICHHGTAISMGKIMGSNCTRMGSKRVSLIRFPMKIANILGIVYRKNYKKFQSKPSLHIADIFHYISCISPLHLLYCWLFIMLKHTQRTRCCFYIPLNYMNLHEITLGHMNLHEITISYIKLP